MKIWLKTTLTIAVLGLAACQSIPTAGLGSGDLARNQRTVLAQIASQPQQADLYFDADGQYHSAPVAGGYYRKVLGQTAGGGWVVQDFYQDSKTKQIDPGVVFHPNGLRNFSTDVVDGAVIWYRPDGTLSQSAHYQRGKLDGWVMYYDEQSRARLAAEFVDDTASGKQKAFNEQGRLIMQISMDENQQAKQAFWYGNGKQAVIWTEDKFEAWDEQGKPITETQAVYLLNYLESRLYQPAE